MGEAYHTPKRERLLAADAIGLQAVATHDCV